METVLSLIVIAVIGAIPVGLLIYYVYGRSAS
jgi:hypothetical protein